MEKTAKRIITFEKILKLCGEYKRNFRRIKENFKNTVLEKYRVFKRHVKIRLQKFLVSHNEFCTKFRRNLKWNENILINKIV